MYTVIVGLIIGLVIFVCCYIGFKQGLLLGINTSKGIVPKAFRSPLTAIRENKLSKEQQKRLEREEKDFMEMLAFTGERKKVTNEN